MNATTIVAIAGLAATTTLGLIGPFLQGRIAARNARQSKNHDLAIAAYTDAMASIQNTEADLIRIILSAPSADEPEPDHRNLDLIAARLRLIAPRDVLFAWAKFVETEDLLRSALREKYDTQRGNGLGQPIDLPEYQAMAWAADSLRLELRRAAGTR